METNERSGVLTVKMYRTDEDETYCDTCSMRFLNSGVSMVPVSPGTPCTCDGCGLKGRTPTTT